MSTSDGYRVHYRCACGGALEAEAAWNSRHTLSGRIDEWVDQHREHGDHALRNRTLRGFVGVERDPEPETLYDRPDVMPVDDEGRPWWAIHAGDGGGHTHDARAEPRSHVLRDHLFDWHKGALAAHTAGHDDRVQWLADQREEALADWHHRLHATEQYDGPVEAAGP